MVVYPWGQCTYYVADVSGARLWLPDKNMGNAAAWIESAKQYGLRVVDRAMVGFVVVYGAGNGYSEFGHVALVEELGGSTFRVSEMHYRALGELTTDRWSSMRDVVGFIAPPGGSGPVDITPENDCRGRVRQFYLARNWGIASVAAREGWTKRMLYQSQVAPGDGIDRTLVEMSNYPDAASLNAEGVRLNGSGGH